MALQAASRTALGAATHRAVHQILEQGRIFTDPLAIPILGGDPAEMVREAEGDPPRRRMRLFLAARSHLAESLLKAAVAQRGVTQLVVLGAGLDTFAYRNPLGDRLRVFEVDHPATQAWKRERLADAGIGLPPSLTFAPVDFERGDLRGGLHAAGFDRNARSFVMWLGVVPYLTRGAIEETLGVLGSLPGGADVVFDHGEPPDNMTGDELAYYRERAARVAALGEPWISFFTADQARALLQAQGFASVTDYGPRDLAARYWPDVQRPERGGHIVHAGTA